MLHINLKTCTANLEIESESSLVSSFISRDFAR